MKNLKIILLLLIITFMNTLVFGQGKPDGYRSMPFQLSVITPIGTNGLDSWNTVNQVSLNMFAGFSGGLDGFEAAGYVNVLRGDMRGVQLAGFANADFGVTEGAQFAGFVNYNKLYLTGAQFSGFANVLNDDATAFQGAGFVNVSTASVNGAQIAGFANVASDDSEVIQLAGFVNAVKGKASGLQGAGFANYAEGNTVGQLAGFFNANGGDLKGVQLSGFGNVNYGKVTGLQASGFINATNILDGAQLGFINYVDSLESGISIGFLTIVRKNGYRKLQLSANESFYANATFKTGTRKFYNIFTVGGSARDNTLIWAYGYGVGTTLGINANTDLNFEYIAYHVHEDKWLYDEVNILNKAQIVANWQFSSIASLYGGPSWNVLVSDTKDNELNSFESNLPPFDVFNKTYPYDTRVIMYPGLSVGVRF